MGRRMILLLRGEKAGLRENVWRTRRASLTLPHKPAIFKRMNWNATSLLPESSQTPVWPKLLGVLERVHREKENQTATA
jgi:hypothetical protein